MATFYRYALADIMKATRGDVERYYNWGLISLDTFNAYAHLWQTGAPRFGPRMCHCQECRARHPSSEGY